MAGDALHFHGRQKGRPGDGAGIKGAIFIHQGRIFKGGISRCGGIIGEGIAQLDANESAKPALIKRALPTPCFLPAEADDFIIRNHLIDQPRFGGAIAGGGRAAMVNDAFQLVFPRPQKGGNIEGIVDFVVFKIAVLPRGNILIVDKERIV